MRDKIKSIGVSMTIFMVLTGLFFNLTRAEERVSLQEEFLNLPKLEFKEEIRLKVGVFKHGPLEGSYYLQYEEKPNVVGQPFPEKSSYFLNAWVSFTTEKNLVQLEELSALVRNVTICYWYYDVENEVKTTRRLEFVYSGRIYFGKVIEDKENHWLPPYEDPILLSDENTSTAKLIIEQTIKEFTRRIKEGSFDFLEEEDSKEEDKLFV